MNTRTVRAGENHQMFNVDPHRLAVAYRQAILNEFELDRYWHLRDAELGALQVVVPRVHKLKKYLKLPKAVLPALFGISVRSWWLLIFGPLMAFKAIVLCHNILRRRAKTADILSAQGAGLIFAGTSIINRSLGRLPKLVKLPLHCLATSPVIAKSLQQAGYSVWLPEDILNLRDVWGILLLSWQIGRRAARSRQNNVGLPLQTYTCLEWVTVAVALSRLGPRTVWMTNLYDRWAVLVDFFCRGYEAMPLRDSSRLGRKCTVLQHGIEYADFPPLYKMRRIDSIWSFHKPSALIYLDLSVHSSEKVTIHDFGSKICLQKGEELPGRYRVLLILHPMISERMHSLVQKIWQDSRFHIFAKPHPLYDQSDFARYSSQSYALIGCPDFFPEVEAVVSYRSALATEYEAVGALILYVEDESDEKIIQKLITYAQ